MFNFVLGQRRNVDLHPPPSFRTQTGLQGHVSERQLGGTRGHTDANNDHVERDRNDGSDLLSAILFQSDSQKCTRHDGLTMSRITY